MDRRLVRLHVLVLAIAVVIFAIRDGHRGGGMLILSVAMALLGQQSVPRRYFTYVRNSKSQHQWVGVGGLVTAVGLTLIVVAIATESPNTKL